MKPSVLVLSLSIFLTAACTKQSSDVLHGYAEAEYVRMTAPIAGTLTKLHLHRGYSVSAGAPAFVLEQENESAAKQEASFRVKRAKAQLEDQKKGKRPDELSASKAQLAQAEAALSLSKADLMREEKLVASKFISAYKLDIMRANVARDQARVNELSAQLRVAQTGARPDEIKAAENEVGAAEAQLVQAGWSANQKTQNTPVAGDVVDTLYREGEWVPAGGAVLTLLPPSNIKARFFVRESILGAVHLGQSVSLSCDGCGAPIKGKVSYIACEAEYTSPLIYSKENRATLVFMIEAKPEAESAKQLHPGQPLEVSL